MREHEFDREKEFLELARNLKGLLESEFTASLASKEADKHLQSLFKAENEEETMRLGEKRTREILENRERVDILIKQLFELNKSKASKIVKEILLNKLLSEGIKAYIKKTFESGGYNS